MLIVGGEYATPPGPPPKNWEGWLHQILWYDDDGNTKELMKYKMVIIQVF